jgi:hypothetical protein
VDSVAIEETMVVGVVGVVEVVERALACVTGDERSQW